MRSECKSFAFACISPAKSGSPLRYDKLMHSASKSGEI